MNLGNYLKKHAQIYSCDDMNKINVGVNAVSRYHEIDRFFTTSNSPEYSDHDFPYPGYKIIVSGYMALENKEDTVGIPVMYTEQACNDITDSMDTDHIQDDITSIENNEESEEITDSILEEDVSTEVSAVVYELITIAEQNAQREGDINEFLRHYKFAGNLASDRIGRTHFRRPTAGSAILTLRSQIFHSSTA